MALRQFFQTLVRLTVGWWFAGDRLREVLFMVRWKLKWITVSKKTQSCPLFHNQAFCIEKKLLFLFVCFFQTKDALSIVDWLRPPTSLSKSKLPPPPNSWIFFSHKKPILKKSSTEHFYFPVCQIQLLSQQSISLTQNSSSYLRLS